MWPFFERTRIGCRALVAMPRSGALCRLTRTSLMPRGVSRWGEFLPDNAVKAKKETIGLGPVNNASMLRHAGYI